MPYDTFRIIAGSNVRVIRVGEFMEEVEAFRRRNFVGAPDGPLTVEALDAQGRLCWRAYYTSFQLLASELC